MVDNAVEFEARDKIGLITINRPDTLNALDMAILDALEARVDEAMADEQVKVIVFTGAGRAFVAGGNIADLNSRRGLAHYLEFAERIHEVMRKIETLDKPTIGAINGWALGGGTELLLCLDIRIAARSAKLGLPEITLGIFPGAGGTQRILRQISPCKARELMFTGNRITAEEAERLGLINSVSDDEKLLEDVFALAETIASKSSLTLKLLKRALIHGTDMTLAASLQFEQAMIGLSLDSDDAHEGCSAFLEKRSPEFKGS